MAGERLVASYIVRVTVRKGERSISLHEVGSGVSNRFGTYVELLEHLGAREEAVVRRPGTEGEGPDGPTPESTEGEEG